MNDKINVCLINDSFPPLIDGVANTVINYASIIEKYYGKATVATPFYPDTDDSGYPYKVVRFPSIDTTKLVGYRAGLPFSAETLDEIKEENIDIIHTHCPVTSTFLARTLRNTLDAPVVLTYHTKFDMDIANAIRGRFLQEAAIKALVQNISACDEVWVVSNGAGENLRSIGYEGDFIVMENGVDIPKGRMPENLIEEATKGYDLPCGVPVFLFVGRMTWQKNAKCTLEALAVLKENHKDFRMVFIGSGADKAEMESYAEKLKIADKCIFTGAISDRYTLRSWYSRADMFLFPSEFDTNGLVVREAAACGTASVLIKGSCAAEGITDGENGVLIENRHEDMAAKLMELMENPDKMKEIGENAMNEIYISWEDSVKKAVERYGTVLENYRSGLYEQKHGITDEWFRISGELLDGINLARDYTQARRSERKKYRRELLGNYVLSVDDAKDSVIEFHKRVQSALDEIGARGESFKERVEETLDRYL